MTDTEIVEWLICHISKLGVKPDWRMSVQDADGAIGLKEWTDIRGKVETLARESTMEKQISHNGGYCE